MIYLDEEDLKEIERERLADIDEEGEHADEDNDDDEYGDVEDDPDDDLDI